MAEPKSIDEVQQTTVKSPLSLAKTTNYTLHFEPGSYSVEHYVKVYTLAEGLELPSSLLSTSSREECALQRGLDVPLLVRRAQFQSERA